MKGGPRACVYVMIGKRKMYVCATTEDVRPEAALMWPEFAVLKSRARFWKPEHIERWMAHFRALMPELTFDFEAEVPVLGLPEGKGK